ncbi:hypothetical protein [Actinoallomurus sp. NPDC052274]|uniref:hypothetical protein n=1 Tax=Actinoallomurus sp. NPDC052274 TaxID=3155420 RepID=UPI003413BACB
MRYWLSLVRIIVVGAALTTGAVTLTACTVPVHGLTGVMLSPSGQLTAVLGWCPGHAPDALILYKRADDPKEELTLGDWHSSQRPAGRYAELTLDRPPPGWRAHTPLQILNPQETYVIYGATQTNSSSTSSVSFTTAALENIPRGTIQIGYTSSGENTLPYVDRTEFQRQVGRRYGC